VSEEPSSEWQPKSSAELCLYLIMTLPEEPRRLAMVKDFVRLYDIRERVSTWSMSPGSEAASSGNEPPSGARTGATYKPSDAKPLGRIISPPPRAEGVNPS
jgi:hypothetical protein